VGPLPNFEEQSADGSLNILGHDVAPHPVHTLNFSIGSASSSSDSESEASSYDLIHSFDRDGENPTLWVEVSKTDIKILKYSNGFMDLGLPFNLPAEYMNLLAWVPEEKSTEFHNWLFESVPLAYEASTKINDFKKFEF